MGANPGLFLAVTIIGIVLTASCALAADVGWFPHVENAQAWRLMPPAREGAGSRLPNWALLLARPLPATTAAMLELDAVQRTKNSLDPRLRAKIRWVCARANGCVYTQADAAADLFRAGGEQKDLDAIVQAPATLGEKERIAVRFARDLCLESHAITDEQAARVLELYGPKDFAGIVLLVAYANFQDRLLQTIGAESEKEGPLPPSTARFDWGRLKSHPIQAPARVAPAKSAADTDVPTRVADAEWSALSPAALRERLEKQKGRTSRIPIMAPEEVEKVIWPDLYPPKAATQIVWHNVTFGYQPELVNAWFFALRRFRDESQYVGAFRQSVFWVVTRSVQCDYCMGHTLMLMEIVGMPQKEIDELVRSLASGDWSHFPPEQRIVYHLARRMTKRPSGTNKEEIDSLVACLGADATLDAIWHISWCNFMVRISNAFQIPLERENVFWGLHGRTAPPKTSGGSDRK